MQPASVSGSLPGGKSGNTPPPPDPGPQAIDQEATTDENTPVNIYWLTYGDTDPNGDRLTLTGVSPGANGSTRLNADGTVTYTPAVNWYGTDTFTYTVSNSMAETATANVSVTVNHVKPPPTANPVNRTTDQNTPITVPLSGSDVEGAALSYFIEDDPTNGTLSAVGDDNTVTYVPNGNFSGTDTFTYEATDNVLAGPPATVTITVNPVVQGPGVTITQLGGSTKVSEVVNPFDGGDTGQYTVVLNTQPAANVVITPIPDSQLSVTPAALTFTAGNWSVPQTVTVSPVDDQVARPEPDNAVITHSAVSTDPNYNGIGIASITVAIEQDNFPGVSLEPTNGPIVLDERTVTSATYTATLTSKPTAAVTVALTGGSRVTLSTTTLTFTTDNWDTPQTVTVQAVHDGIAEGYQEVDIAHTTSSTDPLYQGVTTSLPINIIDADSPNAVPPADASADENGSVTVNVLANAIDPQGGTLTVTSIGQPSNGTTVLNADGTVTYTSQTLWYGTDSFSYTIANGQGQQDTGTATVDVQYVPQSPTVVNPGTQANAEDDKVLLQIAATSPDTDSFLFMATGLPPGLVINPDTGLIWGWIDARGHGSYSTSVTVDDLNGDQTTITFPWTVAHVNHPPHLFHYHTILSHVGGFQGGIPGPLASDIDGDPLSYAVAGLPPGMSYDPVRNTFSGTPQTAGIYQVTDTASDGQGGMDQDTFQWRVFPAGPENAPLAFLYIGSDDVAQTLAYPATPVQLTVLLNASTDPTPYTISLDAPNGGAVISPSSVTLTEGHSVQVTVTPTGVSQKVDDVALRASIDGVETDRVWLTNVGIVLPNKVNAPDTPAGMVNRISLDTNNLGTYQGAVSVYPSLMGLYQPSLQVVRPQPDDKYGNAAVSSTDLSVNTHLVATVFGTVETTFPPDGGNAANLQLSADIGGAIIGAAAGAVFAVANIPAAVEFTAALPRSGIALYRDPNNPNIQTDWFWGIRFEGVFKTEKGQNFPAGTKVKVREFVKIASGSGILERVAKVMSTQWGDPGGGVLDFNGVNLPPTKFNQRQARAKIQGDAQNGKLGGYEAQQNIRYYVGVEPKKFENATPITKSGYRLIYRTDQKNLAILAERKPKANNGAEKGLIKQAAAGQKKVPL